MGAENADALAIARQDGWLQANVFDYVTVDPLAPNCWRWGRAINPRGYGMMRIKGWSGGPACMVHRVVWIATTHELIPDHLEIDHMCGQTDCCNPAHLRLVDRGTNISYGHFRKRWQAGLIGRPPTRRRRRPGSIRVRTTKAGIERYAVQWREDGEDRAVQRSKVFDTETEAKRFLKTLPFGKHTEAV